MIQLQVDIPKRSILIHCHQPNGDRGVNRIDVTNPAYDPLAYPLLFPHGDPGWNMHMQQSHSSKSLSLRQYYKYHMMDRSQQSYHPDNPMDPDFNVLHHAGNV